MHSPTVNNGWGAQPHHNSPIFNQGWIQVPHHYDGSMQQPPYQWPGIMDAVSALPPHLNKAAWDLHNQSGVPLEIILGELLTILVFVCSGVANVRDIKGDPTPISTIAYILGLTLSNKSTGYRRLMRAVMAAMDDWDSEWLLVDITAAGLKKLAPELGLYVPGPEEGGVHFEGPISREYALFISLRDSIMPPSIRATRKKKEGKSKGHTRFTAAIISQKAYHDEWLEKHRKKALASGMLQRVWIVWTLTQFDKSIIGRYPDAVGGLDYWDEKVPQLMEQTKENISEGLESLPTLDVSMEAQHVLRCEQDQYDQLAKDGGPLAQDPAFVGRRHETMTVLAAIFHLFEGDGEAVSGKMMSCAATITAFLTGQWWSLVHPPAPISDAMRNAERLWADMCEENRRTGSTSWPKSKVSPLAPNYDWSPADMAGAIRALCASGRAQVIPRTINGRCKLMLEMVSWYGSPSQQATAAPSEPEMDARKFFHAMLLEYQKAGRWCWPKQFWLNSAENLGMTPSRLQAAMVAVCGVGQARIDPNGVIDGKPCVTIELIVPAHLRRSSCAVLAD